MKAWIRHVAMMACTASVLSGCAMYRLEELRHTIPGGSPFQNALSRHYMDFATLQEKHYDWANSWHFADKGLRAAYGKDVPPEMPEEWSIPKNVLPYMQSARTALLEAENESNLQVMPQRAADAQYYFDCWVKYQDAAWDHDKIEECREGFSQAMHDLHAPNMDLGPHAVTEEAPAAEPAAPQPQVEPTPTPTPTPEAAPAAPEAPAATPVPVAPVAAEPPIPEEAPVVTPVAKPRVSAGTLYYVVFFEANSSEISVPGKKVIDAVTHSLEDVTRYDIVVNGHTDTSGEAKAALKLSEDRVQSVKKRLIEGGVKEGAIKTFAYGKSDPKFATGDGVPEPANRRVEIFINE